MGSQDKQGDYCNYIERMIRMDVFRQIVELFQSPVFQSFIVSLGAGITWDAIKAIFHKTKVHDLPLENKIFKVFAETYKEYCTVKGYEYDESLVMSDFIKELKSIQSIDSIALCKKVISKTINQEMDEADYAIWGACFSRIISKDEHQQVYRMIIISHIRNTAVERDLSWLDDYMKGNCCDIRCTFHEEIMPLLSNVKTVLSKKLWDDIKILFFEVIYNAQTHGKASDCRIHVDEKAISITDNGQKFNPLSLVYKCSGGGSIAIKTFVDNYPKLDLKYQYQKERNNLTLSFDDSVFNINQLSEIIVPSLISRANIEFLYPNTDFKLYFIDIGRTISLGSYYGVSFSMVCSLYGQLIKSIDVSENKHVYIYFPKEIDIHIYSVFLACLQNCIYDDAKELITLIPQHFEDSDTEDFTHI